MWLAGATMVVEGKECGGRTRMAVLFTTWIHMNPLVVCFLMVSPAPSAASVHSGNCTGGDKLHRKFVFNEEKRKFGTVFILRAISETNGEVNEVKSTVDVNRKLTCSSSLGRGQLQRAAASLHGSWGSAGRG